MKQWQLVPSLADTGPAQLASGLGTSFCSRLGQEQTFAEAFMERKAVRE